MSSVPYSDLIATNGNLSFMPHISYYAVQPDEIVHPRVTYVGEIPHVYSRTMGGRVTLDHFLHRLATNRNGLRVGAYRSNGKGTSIAFSRQNRVVLSPKLLEILEEIRTRSIT